jgi:uncharacterized protein (UPF0332 family)
MADDVAGFLLKAEENLAAAEREFVDGRYNACANRCYYACFQAAIAALRRAGVGTRDERWGHDRVGGQFAGLLVNRRKLYSPELRDVLSQTSDLRQTADYTARQVTEREASRSLRRARRFVTEVLSRGVDVP